VADEQLCWSICPGVGEVTVFLRGELDCATEIPLTRLLSGVVRRGFPLVTVDLAEVTFLDSSGLRCLLQAAQDAAARGTRLVTVHATGTVRRVFAIAGLERELLGEMTGDEEIGRPVAS
jgi:anti-anti-sigma factor